MYEIFQTVYIIEMLRELINACFFSIVLHLVCFQMYIETCIDLTVKVMLGMFFKKSRLDLNSE